MTPYLPILAPAYLPFISFADARYPFEPINSVLALPRFDEIRGIGAGRQNADLALAVPIMSIEWGYQRGENGKRRIGCGYIVFHNGLGYLELFLGKGIEEVEKYPVSGHRLLDRRTMPNVL